MTFLNISNNIYCKYCSDENGNLYPREVVQKGIAEWLKGFAQTNKKNKNINFMQKADYYMKSMPAWWE
jgi:hypothetical protein